MRNVLLILLAFVLTSFTSVEKVNLNNYSNESLLQQNKLESDWKEIKKAILAKDLNSLKTLCKNDKVDSEKIINEAAQHFYIHQNLKSAKFKDLRIWEYNKDNTHIKMYIYETSTIITDQGVKTTLVFTLNMVEDNGKLRLVGSMSTSH